MLGIEEIDRNIITVRTEYYLMAHWVYKKEITDPAIAPLGTYPNEVKSHTKTCTQMLTAALFILTKNWEATKLSFDR